MARQDKSKPGRVTPKGTVPKGSSSSSSSSPYAKVPSSGDLADSGSFRPDETDTQPLAVGASSPVYVPILMFAGLGLGFIMILGNYLVEGFLGTPNNWYLVGGLGLVLAGIITATQYK